MKIRTIILSVFVLGSIFSTVLRATQTSNDNKMVYQAISNNDTPKLIKALISEMKNKLEVDEDSFPNLLKEVETYTAKQTDPATIAILHSMTAEMYNHYYQINRWIIDRRTPIEGYVPDDIREWTSNLFTAKVKEELVASLEPRDILVQTNASQFKELMKTGKDSPALRPTLYEFLAYRAIDIQSSEDIYQDLLAYLNTKGDTKSAVLAMLAYGQSEASLDSLLNLYKDKPYAVEIIAAKLDALRSKSYQPETADSIHALQYQIAKDAIARYPQYERIGLITNWLASMEEPFVQIENKNTVYPGKDLELSLKYKNLQKVTVKVYRSKKAVEETIHHYYNPSNKKQSTLGELVKETSFTLDIKNTYSNADTILRIRMDEPGLYEYVITSPGKDIKASNLFSVTRLAASSRSTTHRVTEVLVTDYLSGKPVSGATVNYYRYRDNKYTRTGAVKTDKDGLAILPKEDVSAYQAYVNDDAHSLLTTVYTGRGRYDQNKQNIEVRLLTDRGIYRPGQTVFFKGIAYNNSDSDNPMVVNNKRFDVVLRDANYQEVTTKSFSTNQFGSFTGEFTLPRQTLTGHFTLVTEGGSVNIRVEEYKRPTFKIDIDPVKEEVAFGDEVTIKGKAQTFSGVMLQSGEVTYRVVRSPFWFRIFNYDNVQEQVAEGKTTVGSDGTFSFVFRPEKSDSFYPLSFNNFDIIVSLTDSKNETQETRSTFSVGDRSMILDSDIQSQVEKESVEVKVRAMTLNGEEIPANGQYTIFTLEDTAKPNEYKEGKQTATGSFSTANKLGNEIFSKLPSGRYRLQLTAKDSKGRDVKGEDDFILYSKKDKRPPVFSHTWMLQEKTSCLPGEEAEIIFGTSDKEAYVLYELFSDDKNVSRKRIVLNNENQSFKIPFLESYGDGVVASFTFVKEGELYTKLTSIQKKQPNKSLTIKPETFRDHLLPGSKESWKFRILDADSLAASAEVLAGMYDASLDKIAPFAWYFSPLRQASIYYSRFSGGEGFRNRSDYSSQSPTYADIPSYAYDRFDWQGALDIPRSRGMFYSYAEAPSMRSMAKSASPMAKEESMVMADDALGENIALDQSATNEEIVTGAGQGPASATPSIRTNFNETAFFFPTLTTDKEGGVSINFTIPESNTTWKLQTLAHTKDLKSGLSTLEVITQKPLMVLPNLPRFVRNGDEVSISTQVMNLSDKTAEGLARLELFNPADEQPIVCLTKSQRPFTIETNGTATLSWTVPVPEGYDLLGVRIIADAASGSDGEQHVLPILPNELLVTEATPFYLLDEGDKQIKLSGNTTSATRRPYAMTLEFSNNPVWYAVQALPTVSDPREDDIISWFAAYYSNTVAMSIAQSNPRIKQVINQWKAQGGTASTLLSNLEKNEELKNILLQETPWVMNAKSETEQKQRLSLLFDINRASQQRETAMKVLIEHQQEAGGWGWYKGFYPSRGITLFILDGMAQLVRLSAVQYNQQEKEMQMKALKYLDTSIQKDYEVLAKSKKSLNDYVPTLTQVNFLYIRSHYRDIPEWGEAREGIRYFTNQAEKQWSKMSLYEKGQVALLMQKNGKKEVAKDILSWLRKTATTSNEQGMYWANNKREKNFFHSPIDVHSLLMTTFHELGTDTKETDRMKQWLLNQKRTQDWKTVPSTVNAIYSLLSTGSDWLSENNTSVIRWGDKTIDQTSAETGTGYIKEVVSAKEITPSMNSLTIHKEGKAPAWGAVYNQYFEAIDKVEKQTGSLNVEKKLFVETNSGTQRQIEPVTPERTLRTGDKVVVRLTVRTDQDMDYVSLKDIRPGCFEPASQVSGYMFADGVVYYHSPKDVSENFYFHRLPAGTYVLEYSAFVSRTGKYNSGLATIQCQYAPEFVSHTEGGMLIIE